MAGHPDILDFPFTEPIGATLVEAPKQPELPRGASLVEEQPLPAGAVVVEPDPPSLGDRIVGRFFGTDVDDPLELPRLVPTVAGAIAGGIAGAKTGAFLGALTGPAAPVAIPAFGIAGGLAVGAIGAFIGAESPELVLEAGEALGFLEEGTREAKGLSPEDLRTLSEGEALLDLATGGGLVALRGVGRLTATILTGARKATAEAAARHGIDMMPVQVGGRVLGRGFVTVFGRFPLLGGGKIRDIGQAAEEQLRKVVLGLSKRLGPLTDTSELGNRIYRDAKNLVEETNAHFRKEYTDLFARAEDLGVFVVPRNVLEKANEILSKLSAQTPAQLIGEADPGVVLKKVKEFIDTEILPMRKTVEGAVVFANQSLRQMDGVISKIDQEIASLEPGQKKFARSLLIQLRQAAQRDVIGNVRGINADEIGRAMSELDTEFSHTMSQLFETSTAKRFGTVEKRGLRGVAFDKTTRTPVDQLARVVINLNSPQAIDELARLVTPETFARIAAQTIDDAMQMAMKTDGFVGQLDIEVFAKRLGLDGTNEARRKVIGRMMEKSGTDLTLKDLDEIVEIGRVMAGFDIPNVSAFIARRGAIGGLQGVLNGVVPGMALLGGGAGAAFSAGPVLGMIFFVGGSHMFARVIANPKSARALHKVFIKELAPVARRKAGIAVLRGGLEAMRDLGEITAEKYTQLLGFVSEMVDAYDLQIEQMKRSEGATQ